MANKYPLYVGAGYEFIAPNLAESKVLRVNEKFGTKFVPFVHTEENVERCFRLIEKWDMEDTGRSEVTEPTVARPSEVRERLKNELRKLFHLEENAAALEEARETYRRFLEAAQSRCSA